VTGKRCQNGSLDFTRSLQIQTKTLAAASHSDIIKENPEPNLGAYEEGLSD
jgi:hypothetical protein